MSALFPPNSIPGFHLQGLTPAASDLLDRVHPEYQPIPFGLRPLRVGAIFVISHQQMLTAPEAAVVPQEAFAELLNELVLRGVLQGATVLGPMSIGLAIISPAHRTAVLYSAFTSWTDEQLRELPEELQYFFPDDLDTPRVWGAPLQKPRASSNPYPVGSINHERWERGLNILTEPNASAPQDGTFRGFLEVEHAINQEAPAPPEKPMPSRLQRFRAAARRRIDIVQAWMAALLMGAGGLLGIGLALVAIVVFYAALLGVCCGVAVYVFNFFFKLL